MIPVAHIEHAVNGNPHMVGNTVLSDVHDILHLVGDAGRKDKLTGREEGEEANKGERGNEEGRER